MGYSQGLSGLNAASNQLDTIGNNIANSSTVGFKSGTDEFADMYANTIATAVSTPVGIGVQTVTVSQNFGQGTITSTGVPLDVAINGNGFFRMSVNGVIEYSRNGSFHTDSNGYIINAEGANLTGYPVGTAGVVATTNPQPLQIPTGNMPPQVTSNVNTVSMNLDSSQATPATTPFSPTDDTSYSYSNQITTYDSLGDSHTMQVYYVRNTPTSPISYDVYATEDGTLVPAQGTAGTAGLLGTLSFSTTGTITGFTAVAGGTQGANADTVSVTGIPTTTGATTPMSVNFNFTGATAYGGTGNQANLQPDGYTAGNYEGVTVSADGTVVGTYDNGQTRTIGQIVLATFNNPNGLKPVGNNEWIQTAASGQPSLGTPSSATFGALTSGALENSNVDLTGSLVDLITAQRFYQANAQTIKTQNTVDQTLLNM